MSFFKFLLPCTMHTRLSPRWSGNCFVEQCVQLFALLPKGSLQVLGPGTPLHLLGAQAYCDQQLDPPPSPPDEDWDRPFGGLQHAALTAPGPSGTRLEHITDLLNVPRRVHASKVHAALAALFCRLCAGSLPPPPGGSRSRGTACNAKRTACHGP